MERWGASVWSLMSPAPTPETPTCPRCRRGADRPKGPAPRMLFLDMVLATTDRDRTQPSPERKLGRRIFQRPLHTPKQPAHHARKRGGTRPPFYLPIELGLTPPAWARRPSAGAIRRLP